LVFFCAGGPILKSFGSVGWGERKGRRKEEERKRKKKEKEEKRRRVGKQVST